MNIDCPGGRAEHRRRRSCRAGRVRSPRQQEDANVRRRRLDEREPVGPRTRAPTASAGFQIVRARSGSGRARKVSRRPQTAARSGAAGMNSTRSTVVRERLTVQALSPRARANSCGRLLVWYVVGVEEVRLRELVVAGLKDDVADVDQAPRGRVSEHGRLPRVVRAGCIAPRRQRERHHTSADPPATDAWN